MLPGDPREVCEELGRSRLVEARGPTMRAAPSRPCSAFCSNRAHSGPTAARYASKSFRRTRGRSAGGTAGRRECAAGGALFLCGLFTTVEIAEDGVNA